MKIHFPKFKTLIKKNLDLVFLISAVLIATIVFQTYNAIKEKQKKHLFAILNNIYFEKTLKNIVQNLDPRYLIIEHKILSGETFSSILNSHEIPLKEINKIIKILSKKNNINKLFIS